jgi:NADH-quinone oxidoreductase subunit L
MWFLTFTGKPRDAHVFEHAHESPWMMTVPLILLAIMSVCVAWGWPLHHPGDSWVGEQLYKYSRPASVATDFARAEHFAHEGHDVVGMLALATVILGLAFAVVLYLTNVLDPDDAKSQFARVHRFLAHKWYFDEIYSVLLVRPALAIAHWCRNFDTIVIDGFVNLLGKWNVMLARWSGRFDKGIIDGLVNLLADVSLSIGYWLRNVQTGYLRSYILFLALAGMALWVLLYAWAQASGSP